MNTDLSNIRVINYDGANGSTIVPPTLMNAYSVLSVPAYYRAMNIIADSLASLPRSVRQEQGQQRDDFAHPLDRLLRRRPNGYASPYALWRTFFFHTAHTGNGFLRIERDPRTLRPVALHTLFPGDVCPVRYLPEGETSPVQLYLVRSLDAILPGDDVIHLQLLSYDGMRGTDPVALHDATFQRAATLDRYQTRYLQKGSVIRGSITIPGEISDERIEAIQQRIKHYYSGEGADRDVMVLPNGATMSNATISPQQSQILEQTTYTTKQISQITGVPPELLAETGDAKYVNNVESAGANLVRFCLRPFIEQAEEEMSAKLLTVDEQDAGLSIAISADALIRGDTATTTTTTIAKRNAGIITANEARDALDLPRLDDPAADMLKVLGDSTKPADASKAA